MLFNGSRQSYWKQETDCFISKSLLQVHLRLGAKDIYSSSIAVRKKRFERDFATFERSCGFLWAPSSSLSTFKSLSSTGYSGNSVLPGQSFSETENNCPCHRHRCLLAWQILVFLANKMLLSHIHLWREMLLHSHCGFSQTEFWDVESLWLIFSPCTWQATQMWGMSCGIVPFAVTLWQH